MSCQDRRRFRDLIKSPVPSQSPLGRIRVGLSLGPDTHKTAQNPPQLTYTLTMSVTTIHLGHGQVSRVTTYFCQSSVNSESGNMTHKNSAPKRGRPSAPKRGRPSAP